MTRTAQKSKTPQGVLEVVNPYDLKTIGSVPLTCWDSIDNYLDIAQGLFRD